jgi:hypothetical protein
MNCCGTPVDTVNASSVISPVCKECNGKARKVEQLTIEHILKDEHQSEIKETQYYFCGAPDCEVVYFSNETGQYFTKADVQVRVGLKEKEDPIPICYCFGHTLASAREEIARTGRSTVVATITAETQAGRCACEIKNPSGSCCLGEVSQAVKALLKEQAMLSTDEVTSGPAVEGSSINLVPVSDCCRN